MSFSIPDIHLSRGRSIWSTLERLDVLEALAYLEIDNICKAVNSTI